MQEHALDEPEVYPPRAEVAGLPKLLCPLHAMVLSLGCVCVCVRSVASICLTLATPWTVACQAPLSVGFSRQEYWSGLPFPSLGDLPHPVTIEAIYIDSFRNTRNFKMNKNGR